MSYDLNRFVEQQKYSYDKALNEIINERKESHWMWWIFPQIKGLGFSSTSEFYGIENIEEAKEYLKHPTLGKNLHEICNVLLSLDENDAYKIFGSPDDLKLKSSMTLFSEADLNDGIFQKVLDKFYNGEKDKITLDMLKR